METETLMASDYRIYQHIDSKFAKDKILRVEVGIGCPRCRTALFGKLRHGEERDCPHCGLHIQIFGNGLHVREARTLAFAISGSDDFGEGW